MKNNTFFILLVLVFLGGGCSPKINYVADIDTQYYRIDYHQKTDSEIDKMIAPYKHQLDAKMQEVIAYNPKELLKGRPSSLLGNWFTDVVYHQARKMYGDNIDFAIQNYGGLRVPSLKKGAITVGNIYELMPFDNQVVILEMDGLLAKTLLDRIAALGGWPVSEGLSFSINNDKATDIMIQGKPWDAHAVYHVAMPDYIANGGDRCFFLRKAKREDKDILIRDMILDYLRQLPEGKNEIIPDTTQRITIK